jgi:hypothetical protein
MSDWGSTWKKAEQWSKKHYPQASPYHRSAFANSVAYFVTGISGGSGPSVREHISSWALSGDGYQEQLETNLGNLTVQYPDGRITPAGKWKFAAACSFCAPICFGPLPAIAKKVYKMEHCFDDDPEDLKLLEE